MAWISIPLPAAVLGVLTIAALLWRPMGPLPLMGGAVLGAMRKGAWGGG
jgi:hypothetical protein